MSLVVPLRPDGAERDRNWRWIRARYETLYPDWEMVTDPGGPGPWSKGSAVNAAAARASGEVLIVVDADVVLPAASLTGAVAALADAPWVIPHRVVYRLNERATEAVIAGELDVNPTPLGRPALAREARRGPAGGGAAATRREDFEAVGGVDPRFVGWGGEDISFARALDTLSGPHRRLEAALWHLWHRPTKRRPGNRASAESERLAASYLDASGDPVAMAELCAQHPYPGVAGGGAVVVPREVVKSVPVDERFVGWG